MYWGIEDIDGSLPFDEKKKDFYINDFESDIDYGQRLYRAYRKPKYRKRNLDLYFGAPAKGKPTCKAGAKLVRRKDGKLVCRTYKTKKSKYPWKVFPTGGFFGFGKAIGKVGNFVFMILFIVAAVYLLPYVVRAGTSIAKGAISTYGEWKKVKQISTKEVMEKEI